MKMYSLPQHNFQQIAIVEYIIKPYFFYLNGANVSNTILWLVLCFPNTDYRYSQGASAFCYFQK